MPSQPRRNQAAPSSDDQLSPSWSIKQLLAPVLSTRQWGVGEDIDACLRFDRLTTLRGKKLKAASKCHLLSCWSEIDLVFVAACARAEFFTNFEAARAQLGFQRLLDT